MLSSLLHIFVVPRKRSDPKSESMDGRTSLRAGVARYVLFTIVRASQPDASAESMSNGDFEASGILKADVKSALLLAKPKPCRGDF